MAAKFHYGGNHSKCPGLQYVDDLFPECLPTSDKDFLNMTVSFPEEGVYFFYAHQAYDRVTALVPLVSSSLPLSN